MSTLGWVLVVAAYFSLVWFIATRIGRILRRRDMEVEAIVKTEAERLDDTLRRILGEEGAR